MRVRRKQFRMKRKWFAVLKSTMWILINAYPILARHLGVVFVLLFVLGRDLAEGQLLQKKC